MSLENSKSQIDSPVDSDNVPKDSIAADVIFRLGDLSYEMETNRYDSLLSATSHLMSFVSIESIALLTLLPTLLDSSLFYGWHIAICYLTVFALLLATLVVALLARYRFKYIELESPQSLGDHICGHFAEFESASDAAKFYCQSIEESYRSIRNRNDHMSKLVKIATVLAIINIAAIIVSIISFVAVVAYL